MRINKTGIIQQFQVHDLTTDTLIGFGHFEWDNKGRVRQILNDFNGHVLVEGFYYIRVTTIGQLVVLNRKVH